MPRYRLLAVAALFAAPAVRGQIVITTITTVPSSSYCNHGSATVGVDGLAVVVASDSCTRLRVAHCSNVECTTATLSSHFPSDAGNNSVAIGGDGLPLIVADNGVTGLGLMHCSNVKCTSYTDHYYTGAIGIFPSLKVGSDGLGLFASNEDLYPSSLLKVSHCDNAACTSLTSTVIAVETGWAPWPYPSVGIQANGLGLIAYLDSSAGRLKVAECVNTVCTSVLNYTLGFASGNPSLQPAGGFSDFTYVAYQDDEALLKVQLCRASDCSGALAVPPKTVANPGSTVDPALVVGSDHLPLVVYSSGTHVRTAHCTDAACNSNVKHEIANVGAGHDVTFVTAVVGADGLPLIVYGDSNGTNTDIKVAHCSDAVCTP